MNGSDMAGTFVYGRKLVNAGFHGIRAGKPAALNGQPLFELAAESAGTVVSMAAAGASVALVASYLMQKRGRAAHTWMYGAVGSALGFVAGVGWKSRKIASSLTHAAMKEVNVVRDQHWLEKHPIDYA